METKRKYMCQICGGDVFLSESELNKGRIICESCKNRQENSLDESFRKLGGVTARVLNEIGKELDKKSKNKDNTSNSDKNDSDDDFNEDDIF